VAPGPGFLSWKLILGRRTKGGVGGHQPIAQHGIINLVGGWGCRGLPNDDRLKRSAVRRSIVRWYRSRAVGRPIRRAFGRDVRGATEAAYLKLTAA
jgi:hypothetical protein